MAAVMLPEVGVRQVEPLRSPRHRVVSDVLTPPVDALPAAPLVVREPQPLAHALAAVNPQRVLFDPQVGPQVGSEGKQGKVTSCWMSGANY